MKKDVEAKQSYTFNSAAHRYYALARGTALVCACLTSLTAQPQAPTESNASGATGYAENCAGCHGDLLTGGEFGPALKGAKFHDKWAARIGMALETFISQAMPPANPGGLAPEVYLNISAFVRESNGLSPPSEASADASAAITPTDESVGFVANEANLDPAYHLAISRRAHRLGALTSVTDQMLRNPAPEDWLHWRRTDDNFGFSPLTQIHKDNVHSLTVAWSLALPLGTNEITPLVHDGVMFLNSSGTVLAIDASTGDTLWKFVRPRTGPRIGPPVTQPHSLAIYEDRLYVPTLDNHVIALDVRSGKPVWDHLIPGFRASHRLVGGPIVAHGKLIQGMAGCSGVGEPGGCFIVGLDAETGEESWRFHTLQQGQENDSWNHAPLNERFGGSVWSSGSYNPIDNLVYIGTGQTYHIAALMRPNPNRRPANAGLYTDTTLALNPDTGQLVWYYQHMARDVWDMDWAFERMILPIEHRGESPNVVATVGKLGIVDAVDAKSGKYVFSYDLGLQTLVTKIDPKTGWKVTDPALEPNPKQSRFICPFVTGVRDWPSTSYDPLDHMLYIPVTDACMDFFWKDGEPLDLAYGLRPRPNSDGKTGGLYAINLATGKQDWSRRYRAPAASAALATAGQIVFAGTRDRYFRATDSVTGEELWRMRLDSVPSAFPISFAADGTQYVAITTGGGNPMDITAQSLTPELEATPHATTLWVLRLPAPTQAKQ